MLSIANSLNNIHIFYWMTRKYTHVYIYIYIYMCVCVCVCVCVCEWVSVCPVKGYLKSSHDQLLYIFKKKNACQVVQLEYTDCFSAD